ncbi:MAG: hypothetical protein Q9227_001626 [Pyrenula ochraceoflavens]
MADDDSYAAFLDKANQDTGSVQSTGRSAGKTESLKASAVDDQQAVPAELKNIDAVYISDSDEGFDPVSLKYNGKSLDGKAVLRLLNLPSDADLEEMGAKEWDPRGQYQEVVKKVEGVTEGEVKVFRIAVGGTRVLYAVLGMAKGGGRVLGVRTVAVES